MSLFQKEKTSDIIRAFNESSKAFWSSEFWWLPPNMKTEHPNPKTTATALPTAVELAMIAAPILSAGVSTKQPLTNAVRDAYQLWDAANAFLQEKARERLATSRDHDE